MTTYSGLYELTPEGLQLFRRVMSGELAPTAIDSANTAHAKPVPGTRSFTVTSFPTAKAMALAICESLGKISPQALAANTGLWAWLTYVMADVLFQKKNGQWQLKEVHRWFPSPPNDYQKAQRHLVRMPVLLWSSLGANADHLICNSPRVLPEIREQLTGQRDMFTSNFQEACRRLYFDEETGSVKRGAGSKTTGGVTRRMRDLRRQLDVTWDMTDLSPQRILDLLPAEFDRFKEVPHMTAETTL
jgi:hypothetical protein